MVAVSVKLICIIMFIFYCMFLLWGICQVYLGIVFPAKVNHSMIVRKNRIPGKENVSGDFLENGNTVNSRAALKAMGNNFENMSSRIFKSM